MTEPRKDGPCPVCGGEWLRGNPAEVWACPRCWGRRIPRRGFERTLLLALLELRRESWSLEDWERKAMELLAELRGGDA